MHWIAPSEKDTDNAALEKRLWDAADQFRANSGLKSQEYSAPVLGLIFLRFAEVRFAGQGAELEKAGASSRRGSRVDEPTAYHAEGILYLVPNARFDFLLGLPEATDIGAKVNEAMRDIEKHNPQLAEDEGIARYHDVAGLCKAARLKEIEAQGWSLNPGRYVGVAPGETVSDEDFNDQLESLNEELEALNAAARELETTIAKNVAEILQT